MSEKKKQILLDGVLSMPEQVLLGQLTQMGGYKVLQKLFDAAATVFQEAPLKLDPENPNYEKLVASRTQAARNAIEFSNLVFNSVECHVKAAMVADVEREAEAVDAVAATFGIHKVPPKAKKIIGLQKQVESPSGAENNQSK